MSDSSGSWPSGCPEKYPWIGGDEPYTPYLEEWEAFAAEQEQEHASQVNANNNNLPGMATEDDDVTSAHNPLLRQMEEVNMELSVRLVEMEHTLGRRDREFMRVTALNSELMDRDAERNRELKRVTAQNSELIDRDAERDREFTRVNAENEELTDRVTSLSTYIVKLWMELSTSKARERRSRTIIIVMVFVFLLAFVKK